MSVIANCALSDTDCVPLPFFDQPRTASGYTLSYRATLIDLVRVPRIRETPLLCAWGERAAKEHREGHNRAWIAAH